MWVMTKRCFGALNEGRLLKLFGLFAFFLDARQVEGVVLDGCGEEFETLIFAHGPAAGLGGEGAELRAPMAITVMSGLLVATFLTLVVIPTMYLGFVEFRDKIFKKKK